ncbi:MAG: hypothetical protein HQL87_02740 [Magnetococcales bacterium]|nr:hypothetical protein [Magnetococcales bacterium]
MKHLFGFAPWRRQKVHGVVAVLRRPDGIGLVHLLFEPGTALPMVARCLFQPEQDFPAQLRLLTAWVRQYGLHGARFVGLLNRDEYLLLPADAPALPRAEWAINMRWKIADRIPYPVEQAVVEIFALPGPLPQEESGKIYVAVAQEATVQRAADLFLHAGLSLVGIDILDLALGRLTDTLPEDAPGLGLLYWTGHGGVIQVRRQHTLFLARLLETSPQPVWQPPTDTIPAFSPTRNSLALDTLAVELRRTFHFYEDNFSQPPLEHLFVIPVGYVGGDAPFHTGYDWPTPLAGASVAEAEGWPDAATHCAALADKLGMRVQALPLERVVQWAPEVREADLIECLPALGAALGWRPA